MSLLKQLQTQILPKDYSKLPFLFWMPTLFCAIVHVFVIVKGMSIAPILIIYSMLALPLSYRYRLLGSVSSCFSFLVLSFAFRDMINEPGFYILAVSALMVSFVLIGLIGDEMESALATQNANALESDEEVELWKSRFENAQLKFSASEEEFAQAKESFESKEEEYYEHLDSTKQLMALAHKENQKVYEQNQRLIKEISALEQQAKVDPEELKNEISRLQKELNETRVQHFQDRSLYQEYKEEHENEPLTVQESVEKYAIEVPPKKEEPASENIYLDL